MATTPAVAAVAIGRIVNGLVVGDIGDARVWAVVVASVLLIEQVIPPLIEPVRTWTYGEGVEGQIAVFFVRWVKGVLSTLVIMQLSVIVAIAVWVIRLAQNEYLLRMYRRGTAIVMGQVPLRRASRYWGEIAGRGEAAKELRTFGFGPLGRQPASPAGPADACCTSCPVNGRRRWRPDPRPSWPVSSR